jgi:quinohemoprotein ethanol dehydrogenase
LNAQYGWAYRAQTRKLLTFVLGGKKSMPYAEPRMWPAPIIPADFDIDDARADRGRELYVSHCVICHGSGAVSGGGAPDLRASQIVLQPAAMKSVVIEGAKIPMGMPRFRELGEADLDALRHYVRRQARDTAKALEQK